MDNTETTPSRLQDVYPARNERRRVRWDPTINMGHVLSAASGLVTAAVFAVTVYIAVNTRVVVLEEAKTYQLQRDVQQDLRIQEMGKDLKDSLAELKSSVNELRRDVRVAGEKR